MKQTPETIAVASTKGGSGKSSITAALAVQAAKEGSRVALLDWEPQGSLTLWWLMRGKPDNPRLIGDEIEPAAAVRKLAGECDWLLSNGVELLTRIWSAPPRVDRFKLRI
jgi:cellulose biosynthesis protein BcsQ